MPPILRSAASVLVVGSLARESVVALGADPPRVRVFANTIDVTAWAERADELAGRRSELRAAFGLAGEVAVLSVARLAPEKGLDVLLRAATAAGVRPLLVGSGPSVRTSRPSRGTRSSPVSFRGLRGRGLCGGRHLRPAVGTRAVGVASEAAASGLPLVLSDRVGAAADLLARWRERHAGAVGDAAATADALRLLAVNPVLRQHYGRSRRACFTLGL